MMEDFLIFENLDVVQKSEEWLDLRHGKLTGSQLKSQLLDTYANRYEEYAEKLEELLLLNQEELDEKAEAKRIREINTLETKLEAELPKFIRRKSSVAFWQTLTARFATREALEPLPPREAMLRGEFLEPINIDKTLIALLEDGTLDDEDSINREPGVWINHHLGLQVSPDCCRFGDKPTWAIETKSLAARIHLEAFLKYQAWTIKDQELITVFWPELLEPAATVFDCIPGDNQLQAISYFAANPYLEWLAFAMYDDRFIDERLHHFYIKISREDVEEEINFLLTRLEDTQNHLTVLENTAKKFLDKHFKE